jgi:hypothetical protein
MAGSTGLAAVRPALAEALRKMRAQFDAVPARRQRKLHQMKMALAAELSAGDAARVLAALFADFGVAEWATRPLRGLRDYAMSQGLPCMERTAAGVMTVAMPELVGRPPAAPVEVPMRALFHAQLRDAVVSSRSSLIAVPGALLFDFQDGELEAIPIDWRHDPQVIGVDRDGGCLQATIVRLGSAPQELPEAINLVGLMSVAFGHWVGEFLPKLLSLQQAGVPESVPVLIDGLMPPSHREAVETLCRGRRPIVELSPSCSVRVGRLWVASCLTYAPSFPLLPPGAAIPIAHLCPHGPSLRSVAAAVPILHRGGPPSRRLFLARRAARHRQLINDAEVQALCGSYGFRSVYLEDLPFAEQLALVQSASHVVGPAGSAIWFAFFYGFEGMFSLTLHPENLDETPSLTAIGLARGQRTAVLLGRNGGRPQAIRGNSDFSVELDQIKAVLESWGLERERV